jgi:hypothetical protein
MEQDSFDRIWYLIIAVCCFLTAGFLAWQAWLR